MSRRIRAFAGFGSGTGGYVGGYDLSRNVGYREGCIDLT
jgi:hypothetical protein